jgi:hypothetical protein
MGASQLEYVARGALTEAIFVKLAPFLCSADWPKQRLELSRSFDVRIARYLDASEGSNALPQIHCFYEVMSEGAQDPSLIAATHSMRAAGHPVRVWCYSMDRLRFLEAHGVELHLADEVIPRALYEEILSGSEIRYFSDIFRCAVLYKKGGLWMDTDVILLRPFPYRGDYFFNLQWRPNRRHFICNNVIYAKPHSHHLKTLYEMALDCYFAHRREFGDVGPTLLSDYIASDAGAELRNWVFSPVLFNSIDWSETDLFAKPVTELADYLNDERVFGVHLWNWFTHGAQRDPLSALNAMLYNPHALSRLTFADQRT